MEQKENCKQCIHHKEVNRAGFRCLLNYKIYTSVQPCFAFAAKVDMIPTANIYK